MTQETLAACMALQGAEFAPDGIPLHFGDQRAEYHAALSDVVLMQRSHEGRIELTDRDRLTLIHRISTNDVEHLTPGEGCITLFLNATGRIIERVTLYNRVDKALVVTEPGRSQSFRAYLQRNVFFNDRLKHQDIAQQTAHFALHGPKTDILMDLLIPGISALNPLGCREAELNGIPVFVARRKTVSSQHWMVLLENTRSAEIWQMIANTGAKPAGSLVYNALRIRAGVPGVGRELSDEYIPLEVGLWDEVNFRKGCYTGQEIIARMESRSKLAKVMVRVQLSHPSDTPADLYWEDRKLGVLSSSVTTPEGEHLGIAFIKTENAVPGVNHLTTSTGVQAEILAVAGTQPALQNTDS